MYGQSWYNEGIRFNRLGFLMRILVIIKLPIFIFDINLYLRIPFLLMAAWQAISRVYFKGKRGFIQGDSLFSHLFYGLLKFLKNSKRCCKRKKN